MHCGPSLGPSLADLPRGFFSTHSLCVTWVECVGRPSAQQTMSISLWGLIAAAYPRDECATQHPALGGPLAATQRHLHLPEDLLNAPSQRLHRIRCLTRVSARMRV